MSSIAYAVEDRVATITLQRPDRLNAIDHKMPSEIRAAVERANDDDKVHVIVLTGAGRAFCAGYDLKDYAEAPGENPAVQSMPWDPTLDYKMMRKNTDDFMSLWRSYKPTIAKVRGHAVAGGSDIATLGGAELALVLSTNRSNTNERWLSTSARIATATVGGYGLAEIHDAGLQINRALDTSGQLTDTGPVINWGSHALTVPISTSQQSVIDFSASRFVLPVSGSLQLGDSRLAGDFRITLDRDSNGQRTWDIDASGVNINLAAAGAQVSLANAAGHLFIGGSTRSGNLTGTAAISGLAGISMSPTPTADSASMTALITAGGEPIAPTSPQPFTPSGLWVQSVVWVETPNDGRSSARGMV